MFIVDEAQAQILEKVISPSALLKTGHHAMYFGTTTRTGDQFTTPAELTPHKHWMYAPSVDRQILRDFAARVLIHHGAESKEAIHLAEQAFDFAGASMGVLIRLLEAIVHQLTLGGEGVHRSVCGTASGCKPASVRTATDSEERAVHVSTELELEVCALRLIS